jgi:hypothetical protein
MPSENGHRARVTKVVRAVFAPVSGKRGEWAMYALRRRLAFLVVFTAAVLAVAGVAHADGNDDHRQGNAGTVKVDDDDVDDAPAPANDPHVICGLRIVVEHGVGSPFDIDFVAQAPTTRAGDDQRLLIVHVPAGDNVSGLIDLRAFVAGIVPHPEQGFHISITVHLPGGDKHKVIWIELCPQVTTTTTTATTPTTLKAGTTTTTVKTTAPTISGTATQQTTTTVPTQVLGESFSKSPAAAGATSLANTGNPLSPALAVGFVLGGLGLLGAARHASGRRLEARTRRAADRER